MATAKAVGPAVAHDWLLAVDQNAAAQPAETGQGGDAPNPAVMEGDNPFPEEQIGYDPDAGEFLAEPVYPWPVAGDNAGMPVQTPVGYGDAAHQGALERPDTFRGMSTRVNVYPGHDAHSQTTDNYGWDQYTPSGREAVSIMAQNDYVGYDPAWMEPSISPVSRRFATTAIPVEDPETGDLVPLPEMPPMGSQGNGVYETPGPPATTSGPAGDLIDSQENGWF